MQRGRATQEQLPSAANAVATSKATGISANWRPEPEYNAVYVSGTHARVAVNVMRTGTARLHRSMSKGDAGSQSRGNGTSTATMRDGTTLVVQGEGVPAGNKA